MIRNGKPGAERATEGYVYHTYGEERYLRHAVASVISLMRYDQTRPVCLAATRSHLDQLRKIGATWLFDRLIELEDEHCSIPGFKHNLYRYMPYERNLFLDSDIIWCRHPNRLWESFRTYSFTITGQEVADHFFGASKNASVLLDILLRRRARTLKRFGLTYLSRVQSGMVYARDREMTHKVCLQASRYLSRRGRTHFRSRLQEPGRNQESCEWSLAMAMSHFDLPVYPWFQGQKSPQLDFIDTYTDYDGDFQNVKCTYYCDPFVYSFRGLRSRFLQRFLTQFFSLFGGRGDKMVVTPYCLHFGWLHQKKPLDRFANRIWEQIGETAQESLVR